MDKVNSLLRYNNPAVAFIDITLEVNIGGDGYWVKLGKIVYVDGAFTFKEIQKISDQDKKKIDEIIKQLNAVSEKYVSDLENKIKNILTKTL